VKIAFPCTIHTCLDSRRGEQYATQMRSNT
jgi:hypothetical protein